jgi:hypothetical protein
MSAWYPGTLFQERHPEQGSEKFGLQTGDSAMKSSFYYLLWALAGAAVLFVLVVFVLHFQPESVSAQLEAKTRRQEVIGQMRLHLASAVEAEKSAVLATTDQSSQTFADQARAESATVGRLQTDLSPLLKSGREKALLEQFLGAFAEFQRIDRELLELAVKNTNLKAYALAFGPAAEAIDDTDATLSRLLKKSAISSSPNARQVMLLAADAEASALRIETLLPPHIAEESDKRMDELEARMGGEDQRAQKDMRELERLLPADQDVESAKLHYGRFMELKARILTLSRENTNVKSLSTSLTEKRKIAALCEDSLSALEEAIVGEAIPGESVVIPR